MLPSQLSILSGLYWGNQTGAVCGQGASPGLQMSSRSLVQGGGYGSPAVFQDESQDLVSFWEEAGLWAEACRLLWSCKYYEAASNARKILRTLLCKLIIQLVQSLFCLTVYYLTELQVLGGLVLHSTVKIRWSQEKRGFWSPLYLKD